MDGAFPSDKKTIIHGSIVTSTNKIICVGLVVCKSEDAKSVHMLLSQFTNGKEVVFITDEGKAIQKGIACWRESQAYALHLAPAKQLPRAIKLPNESTTDEGTIRDIFYLTARGTATLYDELDKPLDQFPELQNKFYTIRHKWCRGHTSGLRRDYISSISESLNGATRRETARKTQVDPVKSLLKHSVQAYHQCYIEALSLGCINMFL